MVTSTSACRSSLVLNKPPNPEPITTTWCRLLLWLFAFVMVTSPLDVRAVVRTVLGGPGRLPGVLLPIFDHHLTQRIPGPFACPFVGSAPSGPGHITGRTNSDAATRLPAPPRRAGWSREHPRSTARRPALRPGRHRHRLGELDRGRAVRGPPRGDPGEGHLRRDVPERRLHPHQDVRLPGRPGPGGPARPGARGRDEVRARPLAGDPGPDLRPHRPHLQ